MITLYGIPNCDTVKRARTWLAARGVDPQFHDFKRQGLSADVLDRWLSLVGRDRLVNRQGLTWRKLDDARKSQAASDAGARALLLEWPSLVKRPVVEWGDGQVTVGFDENGWVSRLDRGR